MNRPQPITRTQIFEAQDQTTERINIADRNATALDSFTTLYSESVLAQMSLNDLLYFVLFDPRREGC